MPIIGLDSTPPERAVSRRFKNYDKELLIRHVGRNGKRISLSDGSVWELRQDPPKEAWAEGHRVIVNEANPDIPATSITNLDADCELIVLLEHIG